MPTRHAVYGGSNAQRWLNCPGSVVLNTQVPKRPAGAAAQHGSAQHAVMEALLGDPDKQSRDFLGATVMGVPIEASHITAIELALSEYEKIEATFGENAKGYAECEVFLSDEAYGTMDAALLDGRRAAIIDFKFGAEEQVADSDQGKTYGVYARKSLPGFATVEDLELYIIQPAMDPATDKVVMTAAELETFETTIDMAIKVSKQPNAAYIEGAWCKYCDAKLVCPAKTQRLDSLTAPNHILDLDELGERLKQIKSWEKWAEEAQQRLQHEIENGTPVKGWKLVAKRAIRKWKDEAAAILTFKQKNIPSEKYLKTELVSPAQAEKLIPKKLVNELANPVSSGNTIAPADDPRPEVASPVMLGNILKKIA